MYFLQHQMTQKLHGILTNETINQFRKSISYLKNLPGILNSQKFVHFSKNQKIKTRVEIFDTCGTDRRQIL